MQLVDESFFKREKILEKILAVGSSGHQVKAVQEWLNYHIGNKIVIDGEYGPITEKQVEFFQKNFMGEEPDGRVSSGTFEKLVAPLVNAFRPIGNNYSNWEVATEIALRQLREKAREIGAENCGPWVRVYMEGMEGRQWPWCAGFVTTVLRHAGKLPFSGSVSCDIWAKRAKSTGTFLAEGDFKHGDVKRGDLFLVRKTPTDWVHIGFVLDAYEDHIVTIEGNTNDEGSREGYEVCKRIRSYENKDFISI